MNTSPGAESSSICGIRRESEQPMNSMLGCWPVAASSR
jgi:hypothetical protein